VVGRTHGLCIWAAQGRRHGRVSGRAGRKRVAVGKRRAGEDRSCGRPPAWIRDSEARLQCIRHTCSSSPAAPPGWFLLARAHACRHDWTRSEVLQSSVYMTRARLERAVAPAFWALMCKWVACALWYIQKLDAAGSLADASWAVCLAARPGTRGPGLAGCSGKGRKKAGLCGLHVWKTETLVFIYTSQLPVRYDGSQQYLRKISTKKILRFFIDCLCSVLYIIFLNLTNWGCCLLHLICLGTTRSMKGAIRREFTMIEWTNRDYKIT
jgi:hypothetical protein